MASQKRSANSDHTSSKPLSTKQNPDAPHGNGGHSPAAQLEFIGHPLHDYWMYLPNFENVSFSWFVEDSKLFVQIDTDSNFSCHLASRSILQTVTNRFNAYSSYIGLGVKMSVVGAGAAYAWRATFKGNFEPKFGQIQDIFYKFFIACQRSLQPLPGIAPERPLSIGESDKVGKAIEARLRDLDKQRADTERVLQIPQTATILHRDLVLSTLDVKRVAVWTPAKTHSRSQRSTPHKPSTVNLKKAVQLPKRDRLELVQELLNSAVVVVWTTENDKSLRLWLRSDSKQGSLVIPYIMWQLSRRVQGAESPDDGLSLKFTGLTEPCSTDMTRIEREIVSIIQANMSSRTQGGTSTLIQELSEAVRNQVNEYIDGCITGKDSIRRINALELPQFQQESIYSRIQDICGYLVKISKKSGK